MKRERRAPRALLRAVLVVWLGRAFAGLVLGYPVARTVGAFLPPGAASGDAVLFEPGGLILLEALRLGGRAIGASVESALLGFVVFSAALLFPFGVALAGLVHPGEGIPSLAGRAARTLPALLALSGLIAVVQVVGVIAVAGALNTVAQGLTLTNEKTGDLMLVAITVVALLPIVAVGLLHDLARAAVVKTEARARASLFLAWDAFRAGPGRVVLAWAGPSAAGAALVGAAAWGTGMVDVSRPGAARVAAVAFLHQFVVLGLVSLRLVWLSRALALVPQAPALDEPVTLAVNPPSPDDRAAHNGAPSDPTQDPDA